MRHTANPARRNSAGFTLIELMGVVVILGVLAAVAIGAYSRHVRTARKSGVIANLSQLTLRQTSFLGVAGHYASSTSCEGAACTYPAGTVISNPDAVPVQWNVGDNGYTAAAASDSAFFRGGPDVHGFDALRFMPDGGHSWCGYATISGYGTNAADPAQADEPNTGLTLAAAMFPSSSEPYYANDWFYAYALCDFDYDNTYWAFTTSHQRSDVNASSVGPYMENE